MGREKPDDALTGGKVAVFGSREAKGHTVMINDYLYAIIPVPPFIWVALLMAAFGILSWQRFRVTADDAFLLSHSNGLAVALTVTAASALALTAADRLSGPACLFGHIGQLFSILTALVAFGLVIRALIGGKDRARAYFLWLLPLNAVATSILLRSAGSCTI
jgi:hypothetical protein